jgi:DNA-directed RNA polymerase specialized sigma24 family protein
MDAAVVDSVFEQSFSVTSRIAAVRAATIATVYGLPSDSRRDLEQEALLELWRKRPAYDPRRGSWRTFSERVVANRMTSLVRAMRSERSGQFREEPIENLLGLAAPNILADLRADVSRVLAGLSPFDRSVALCLIGHSAMETTQCLGVSRATVYRAIGRLRTAFTEAGLSPWRHGYECDMERAGTGE